jgi:hypothetical protein
MSIIESVAAKGGALAGASRNLRHFHAFTSEKKTVSANDEVAFFTQLAKKKVQPAISTVVSIFSQRKGTM